MWQFSGQSIWIGNVGDGRNLARIHELGIRALVDLAADEKPPMLTRDLIYCRIPLVDGSGNPPELLRLAVRTVSDLLRERIPLLVFCSHGMSRSPAVLACAMASSTNTTPEGRLQFISAQKPTDVTPGFWQDLISICSGTNSASSRSS